MSAWRVCGLGRCVRVRREERRAKLATKRRSVGQALVERTARAAVLQAHDAALCPRRDAHAAQQALAVQVLAQALVHLDHVVGLQRERLLHHVVRGLGDHRGRRAHRRGRYRGRGVHGLQVRHRLRMHRLRLYRLRLHLRGRLQGRHLRRRLHQRRRRHRGRRRQADAADARGGHAGPAARRLRSEGSGHRRHGVDSPCGRHRGTGGRGLRSTSGAALHRVARLCLEEKKRRKS